jgi:hypothetical protein
MIDLGDIFLSTVAVVGASGIVGYVIYRLAAPRGTARTPVGLGRKWFAWMAMAMAFANLPKFFRNIGSNPDAGADALAIFAISIVFAGGLAFLFGWAYGKFFRRNGSASDRVKMATDDPIKVKKQVAMHEPQRLPQPAHAIQTTSTAATLSIQSNTQFHLPQLYHQDPLLKKIFGPLQ